MAEKSGEIKRRGLMFLISSPSGAGKTTLSRLLLKEEENLIMSVSATTRPKRKGDVEGVDYFFMDETEFAEMLQRSEFLECAKVFGNSYGTPEKKVVEALEAGIDVLFDIDWQGTEQIEKTHRDDLVSVFILPPSMAELKARLEKRGLDSESVIKSRSEKASGEIMHWNSYDYVIVNRDIDESLKDIKAILRAERLKRSRQSGLTNFVIDLLK